MRSLSNICRNVVQLVCVIELLVVRVFCFFSEVIVSRYVHLSIELYVEVIYFEVRDLTSFFSLPVHLKR